MAIGLADPGAAAVGVNMIRAGGARMASNAAHWS